MKWRMRFRIHTVILLLISTLISGIPELVLLW